MGLANSIVSGVSAAMNGAWWVAQGFWVANEITDATKEVEKLSNNPTPTTKDYVTVTAKIATVVCDIMSLKADREASKLKGADLDQNKINSAKWQTAALASESVANMAQKGHAIDPKAIVRLLAICRRTGQGIHNKALNYGPTAIEAAPVFMAAAKCMHEMFDHWYERNQVKAARIQYNVDYEGIPEEHHGNPIFSQFLDARTQLPIRFPVTVANPGGPDHHFERSSILEWLQENGTNPVTNLPLKVRDLRENNEMKEIIEDEMRALGLLL